MSLENYAILKSIQNFLTYLYPHVYGLEKHLSLFAIVCAEGTPWRQGANSSEDLWPDRFVELFPCFLMQSRVTMLYPSKHGNGARKTFLNRLPKNTALAGEGLEFYSRSLFKPSSVSTMSRILLRLVFHGFMDWVTKCSVGQMPTSVTCKRHSRAQCAVPGWKSARRGWKQALGLAKWAEHRGQGWEGPSGTAI